MHMWCHVTKHLIISYDKDFNIETGKNICTHDSFHVTYIEDIVHLLSKSLMSLALLLPYICYHLIVCPEPDIIYLTLIL
jgi:hypothetical protein